MVRDDSLNVCKHLDDHLWVLWYEIRIAKLAQMSVEVVCRTSIACWHHFVGDLFLFLVQVHECEEIFPFPYRQ